MNRQGHTPDPIDELSSDLQIAVEHAKYSPVPEAAMQRAIDQAARLDARIARAGRRKTRLAVIAIAGAAACLAIALLFSRSANLWAQVVKAVQAKPWIHAVNRGSKAEATDEFWISMDTGDVAFRAAGETVFYDAASQICYCYGSSTKTVFRDRTKPDELTNDREIVKLFQEIIRGDAQIKPKFADLDLKDQKHSRITKDGREWDQYELHFVHSDFIKLDFHITFLVDAETHLPRSMVAHFVDEPGEHFKFEFDYPATGPADIYALDVPKSAELVDRVSAEAGKK